MTFETIFTEALALPADQRAKLAANLHRSLSVDLLSASHPSAPGIEGSLGDHPLFDEWLAAVAKYRIQREMDEVAFDKLRVDLTSQLVVGAPFIDPPIPQPPSPLEALPLAENPLWSDFLAAVEEYRNRCDAVDRAAYADGD